MRSLQRPTNLARGQRKKLAFPYQPRSKCWLIHAKRRPACLSACCPGSVVRVAIRAMLVLFCFSARLQDRNKIPGTEIAFYVFIGVSKTHVIYWWSRSA